MNQPTPLVYRGVMYLANPRNIIQALEADSGTLLNILGYARTSEKRAEQAPEE